MKGVRAKHVPLTREQQALVVQCAGLVVAIGRSIYGRGTPIPEDALSEGNVGLCRAATLFDPTRGVQFNTYAAWWIRAHMLEYVVTSRSPMRLGSTTRERRVFFHLGRARRFLERIGADVTIATLSKQIGVKEEVVEGVMARMAAVYDVDDPVVRNRASDCGPSPEDEALAESDQHHAHDVVHTALARLDERMRFIVRQRFLLEHPRTLKQLGQKLGVSRERVRQLEEKAIQRLREVITGRRAA